MQYLPIVANFLMGAVFFVRFSTLPPQIPLLYSRPWGEFQLVEWYLIFLIPVLMNFMYFFNKFAIRKYFRENEFAARFIEYLNLFILGAFTFIFIKIVFLVT